LPVDHAQRKRYPTRLSYREFAATRCIEPKAEATVLTDSPLLLTLGDLSARDANQPVRTTEW